YQTQTADCQQTLPTQRGHIIAIQELKPMSMSFDEVDRYVKRLLDEGRLDAAESVLDQAIAKAKAKLKDKSDGETVDDTWSETGDDSTDDGDDQTDGGDDGDDEEEDTPRSRAAKAALDQIEDEVDRIAKALRHSDGVYYPHSETTDLLHHQNRIPTSTTLHSPHGGGSYSTGSWPATRERTSFDDLVSEIVHRDGVSKLEAMSRARREDPQSYHSYQGIAKLGRPKYAHT